jgi:hypothetical protein
MYIIRDIFHLHFGHYRDAKALFDEARKKNMMPEAKSLKLLADFTGDSYRLIFETGYDSLADYEKSLTGVMAQDDWKMWYEKFKTHVRSSHREILTEVM